MIVHDGLTEILNYRKIRQFGLSDEYFFSLPYECQRAILEAGIDQTIGLKKNNENIHKRSTLKQHEFEGKVKAKILTLIKKK